MKNNTTKLIERIIVVDDHPVVTQGIMEILSGIGNVKIIDGTKEEHITPPRYHNSLYIIDLELGHGSGFDEIVRLLQTAPGCKVLVYTMHEEPWIKARINSLDVDGAVSKSEPLTQLRRAVLAIMDGEKYFSEVFARRSEWNTDCETGKDMSEREREVLRLICSGCTSEEIARGMHLSVNTVLTYRKRLLDKFDATNTAQLTFLAKGFIN